jgi:hypothetical protein
MNLCGFSPYLFTKMPLRFKKKMNTKLLCHYNMGSLNQITSNANTRLNSNGTRLLNNYQNEGCKHKLLAAEVTYHEKLYIDFNEPDRTRFRITSDEVDFFKLKIGEIEDNFVQVREQVVNEG